MNTLAELQQPIGLTIPEFIAHLLNKHWLVCKTGAASFSKLLEQARFQGYITLTVPHVIAWLIIAPAFLLGAAEFRLSFETVAVPG
ncbi:hypothetical protein GALMADRAFT_143512 [Galerina marginata CBS 339.88]|uniref:Uncharacterized protein n=1 Tax=Galerina marginata (strain CBS 339.88) TaxID=685588 RepID=A0A067SLC5_GALM3|nr:hypothetical protein GALMADRAFT_143512 [Galerina marginata CBS 339.88]